MTLSIQKAHSFIEDFERQFEWYARKAGGDVARRYLIAVDKTLKQLAANPAIGRVRRFRRSRLKGVRSCSVYPPFGNHLLFYRFSSTTLFVERVLHGAMDLGRRLLE